MTTGTPTHAKLQSNHGHRHRNTNQLSLRAGWHYCRQTTSGIALKRERTEQVIIRNMIRIVLESYEFFSVIPSYGGGPWKFRPNLSKAFWIFTHTYTHEQANTTDRITSCLFAGNNRWPRATRMHCLDTRRSAAVCVFLPCQLLSDPWKRKLCLSFAQLNNPLMNLQYCFTHYGQCLVLFLDSLSSLVWRTCNRRL